MTDKEKLAIAIKALELINLPPHLGWFKDVESAGYDTTGLSPAFSEYHLSAIAQQALYKLNMLSELERRLVETEFPTLKEKHHDTR